MEEKELTNRWYMAWACIGNLSMQEHLNLALEHFRRKQGRNPTVIAVHRKEDGLSAEGVEIIEMPSWVREGELHLYF